MLVRPRSANSTKAADLEHGWRVGRSEHAKARSFWNGSAEDVGTHAADRRDGGKRCDPSEAERVAFLFRRDWALTRLV